MEIDRSELKRQARERVALTDPKFWVVALAYLAMTTGVSWLISLIPLLGPVADTVGIFLQFLLILYTTVVQFGLCLWALWTYRQLDPGINSLMQGFSVAGRVILMELGIYVRVLGWYLLVALGLLIPTVVLMMFADYILGMALLLLFGAVLIAVIIVISLRYALAPYMLADRPDDGPTAPIYRSAMLMRGWKMELFKLEVSFLGWELINLILSGAVILLCLSHAGLLTQAALTDPVWRERCLDVLYSPLTVILSTLVTVPVDLWLLPYRATARAGFYDARILASTQDIQWPQMPPL